MTLLKSLLALSGLLGLIRAMDEVEIKERGVMYDTPIQSTKVHLAVAVREELFSTEEHLYLAIYPQSIFNYEVKAGEKGEERLVCSSRLRTVCVLNLNKEKQALRSARGYRIKMNVECDGKCSGKLSVSVSNHIVGNLGDESNFFLESIKELKVQLEGSGGMNDEKLRIDAIGSPKLRDPNTYSLSGYGNYISSGWPSSTGNDFELRHIHGNQVAHVIYGKDKNFCKDKCKYKLTFNTTGLYKLRIESSFNTQIERIIPDVNIYDILSPIAPSSTTGLYILQLNTEDLGTADVLLTLENLEGDTRLYANPAILPEYSSNSIYSATNPHSKSLIVSNEDMKGTANNGKSTPLFISVVSNGASAYYIRATLQQKNSITQIRENFPISAIVGKGQMRDFGVKWTTTLNEEVREFKIYLNTRKGQVYLYSQYCGTPKKCGFFNDEVVTNKNLASGTNLLYDESANPAKEIGLKAKCGNGLSISSVKISSSITEYTCMINLGVFGKDIEQKNAEFELLVQDLKSHMIIQANTWQKLKVEDSRAVLLEFNIQRRQFNAIDHVQFKFDMHFGGLTVFISKTNRFPCDDPKSLGGSLSLIQNTPMSLNITREMLPEKKIRGTYYICLKPSTLSSVSLSVEPVVTEIKDVSADIARYKIPTLPAGEQLLGEISDPSQILYFSFSASVDAKADEFIQIHITPLVGSFRVFASNNEMRPVPEQSHWNVVGDTLTIKSSDPGFREQGVYIVGITSASKAPFNQNSKQKFLVSYSLSERHVFLRPGMPTTADITATKKSRYFELEIPSSATNFTLIKSSLMNTVVMYISFNATQGYPTATQSAFQVRERHSGIHLNKVELDKYCLNRASSPCFVFIAVESPLPTHFSLQFVVDGNPFTLSHNLPIQIPVLESANISLHFIYQVTGNKNVEFELRPIYQPLDYFIAWSPVRSDNKYTFPVGTDNTTYIISGNTNDAHDAVINRGNTSNTDGVVLVTVQAKFGGPDIEPIHAQYGFFSNGYLELSTDNKILYPGVPVKREVGLAEWKFFRFNHPSAADNILINVELQQGFAEVYVSKGLQKLPSETNFIYRRYDAKEEIITIDKNSIPYGQTLSGDYMIGIKGVSANTRCSVVYNSGAMQMMMLPMGISTTYSLSSKNSVYMELYSDYLTQDIDVTFKSTTASIKIYALARNKDVTNNEWPTPERYVWNASVTTAGGFGRLRIDKSNPAFCTFCQMVLLVQASTNDKVEFLARKKSMYSKIRLVEGKEYVSVLGKGESDTYVMIIPYNESEFSLEMKIHRGNLTLFYSYDPLFNNPNLMTQIKEKAKDEFFTIQVGRLTAMIKSVLHMNAYRFIKVQSLAPDSEYTLNLVSNNMLTELSPLTSRFSILGQDGRHIYYATTSQGEEIDLSVHLRNMVEMHKANFEEVIGYLPGLVTAYFCTTYKQVVSRKYDYEAPIDVSMFHHELRVNLKHAHKGYIVFVIENNIGKALSYSLTMSKAGVKLLAPNHESAELVGQNATKTFIIDQLAMGSIARVKIDQCLGGIEAKYAYAGASGSRPDSELVWENLVSSQVNNGFLRARENEQIKIKVFKENSSVNPDVYSMFERRFSKDIPSVFSIAYDSEIDGAPDTGVNKGYIVVGDLKSYGDVEVLTDSEQTIRFHGLTFHRDFLDRNHEYFLMVNYTLYMSKDKYMLKFMKLCDYFRIDLAEKALDTSNHYSFSHIEYFFMNMPKNQHELPSVHSIQPTTLSFGGVYYGVIVAEIRMWKKSDDNTFPKAQTLRVFYNEFEFEPADLSVALLFLFTLMGLAVIVLLLYVMARKRLLDGLRNVQFFQSIIAEFNEDNIGNNLVLEIIDHKKKKRDQREQELSMADASAANLDQSNVSPDSSLQA